MGGHHRRPRRPDGGVCPGNDPKSQTQEASRQERCKNQTWDDETFLYTFGHVSKHEKPGASDFRQLQANT